MIRGLLWFSFLITVRFADVVLPINYIRSKTLLISWMVAWIFYSLVHLVLPLYLVVDSVFRREFFAYLVIGSPTLFVSCLLVLCPLAVSSVFNISCKCDAPALCVLKFLRSVADGNSQPFDVHSYSVTPWYILLFSGVLNVQIILYFELIPFYHPQGMCDTFERCRVLVGV